MAVSTVDEISVRSGGRYGQAVPRDRNGRPLATDLATTRAVGYWLLCVAGLVFAMAIIGAITRLTESGLSMVEWRPLLGTFPPVSQAEWQRIFELYRQIPEYQQINRGMSLDEFKTIFWWEYIHRVFGRLIGIAYAVPLVWFLVRGAVRRAFIPRLILLLCLGGAQGVLGWIMVQSGFADRVDVSQYKLTAHLTLALAIFALLVWTALDVLNPQHVRHGEAQPIHRRLYTSALMLLGLVFVTIVSGGFVAGLNAGLVYNEWPLMGGSFVPNDYWGVGSPTLNAFENHTAVQFHHRWIAAATALCILMFAIWIWRSNLSGTHRAVAAGLASAVSFQFVLGIATLLSQVPVGLGALHQGGAITVLGLVVAAAHALRREIRPPNPSVPSNT
ncbi:MAG: COX15/CtaA family protein [Pseudomonadota bacterium]